jgi:acid stress-induced BolA-like protein IbaG/YrbA
MSIVDRHRSINSLFDVELKQNPNDGGIHALSITAKTPSQWEKSSHHVDESPACLGGSKHDQKQ